MTHALVLFSGGQDSTVCLAWALSHFAGVETLGFDYGLTVSGYQADTAGRACGVCDSCRLRRAGFEAAGVADPTHYC